MVTAARPSRRLLLWICIYKQKKPNYCIIIIIIIVTNKTPLKINWSWSLSSSLSSSSSSSYNNHDDDNNNYHCLLNLNVCFCLLQTVVVWFVTPCCLGWRKVDPEEGGNMFLQYADTELHDHTLSWPRKPQSEHSLTWKPKILHVCLLPSSPASVPLSLGSFWLSSEPWREFRFLSRVL